MERADLHERLSNGYCDLVMAGVAVTTLRAEMTLYSRRHISTRRLAFVVPDHARDTFASWDAHPEPADV